MVIFSNTSYFRIFGGGYTAASAALIEVSANEQEKIKNIKLMTLTSLMGFIISPVFSMLVPAKLTTLSITLPFTLVFILSVLNLILIILFFPKTQQNASGVTQPRVFQMLYTSFSFIFRNSNILKLGLVFFLFQLGYFFYFQILALYLQQIYNFSLRQTGLLFFMMGICYIFGMYIVHPFLNRFFSNNVVTGIGIISASLLIGILGVNELVDLAIKSQIYMVWLINALLFIMIPLASINISRQFIEMAKDNQGLVMGALGQITSLSMICSAVLVSFHIYFANFVLLLASFIIFCCFFYK
ncbi:MAG: hypothetical protein K0R94_1357 [Burkholderiales bacterium]|jgi:predicted MFS family arabinose efflux permease|nr:hypothetical protein [Burkholderiales bacterium]